MLSSLSSTIITVFDIADLAYLGPDASAKTLRGQRIGGSAQQPPRTGNARDGKRKDAGPSRERLSQGVAPPSANTSKSSSFHSPEGRLAEARLGTNVTFVPWPPATREA